MGEINSDVKGSVWFLLEFTLPPFSPTLSSVVQFSKHTFEAIRASALAALTLPACTIGLIFVRGGVIDNFILQNINGQLGKIAICCPLITQSRFALPPEIKPIIHAWVQYGPVNDDSVSCQVVHMPEVDKNKNLQIIDIGPRLFFSFSTSRERKRK